MNKYICTNIVRAEPMTRQEFNDLSDGEIPLDGFSDKGFYVDYDNGYYGIWMPDEVFQEYYRSIYRLTFGEAIEALKAGQKLARTGWNGKGMFVYYVPAAHYPAQTGVAKAYFGEDTKVHYNAYIAIKNTNESVSTWIASINDILAEDWAIVE